MRSTILGAVTLVIVSIVLFGGLGWFIYAVESAPPPSCERKASNLHSRCMAGVMEGDGIRACTELLIMERARCGGDDS